MKTLADKKDGALNNTKLNLSYGLKLGAIFEVRSPIYAIDIKSVIKYNECIFFAGIFIVHRVRDNKILPK